MICMHSHKDESCSSKTIFFSSSVGCTVGNFSAAEHGTRGAGSPAGRGLNPWYTYAMVSFRTHAILRMVFSEGEELWSHY